MNTNETCIPAAAVELDGVAPSPGDTITFETTATVNRVEGGQIYATPTAANGQPLAAAAAPDGLDLGADEDALRASARAVDDEEAML